MSAATNMICHDDDDADDDDTDGDTDGEKDDDGDEYSTWKDIMDI